MSKRRSYLTLGAVILAVSVGGAAVALATGRGDDGDVTVTGPAADQAKSAALKIIGDGTANAVERDSEDGATWEVEVTRPDGQTADVRLDENLGLVTVESDGGDETDGEAEAGAPEDG